MLVLPHADRLGVDLDELGKRILQTARDRDGAAVAHVELGQFGGGRGRSRIHGRTRFAHHDLGQAELGVPRDQIGGEFVGFAACRAVAD